MRGASTSHPHSRPCFGRKTLRGCRNSEEADDDVILIDVDSDHFDNVIIIDAPDSLPKKQKGSSRLKNYKNRPLQTVIYIDDDESQDKFNSFAGASSSRRYKSPAEDLEQVDAAENPFIQENATPVRLSKCKRTYLGKASAGKGYGLNLDSENDSSDNDHADCEVMEDISGKVRKQWKKAFYRRKNGIKNDQSGIRSQNGATRVMNDCSHGNGRKGENDKHMDAPQLFDAGKFSNEDEGTSPLSEGEDAYYNSTNMPVGGSSYRGQHSPSIHIEPEDHQYFEPGTSSWHNENRSFTPASDAVESAPGESSWFQNSSVGSRDGINKGCHGENRRRVDVIPLSRSIHVHINDAKVGLFESVSNSGEEDKDDNFHSENGHAVDSVESCMLGEREKLKETDGYKRDLEEECASPQRVLKIQAEVAQHFRQLQKRSKAENGHTMNSVESCIIGEREKFKETDEYKRAMEEELASRQQALKIQAEEAQRLRRLQKRRKTESMRLMDMERRQKERIEEMRSTQKKDEENMNLKEVIRPEVRKELNRLEMACQNLSSLLHAFGIQIEGWPNPSPQEVQTAYKKALLTFHPDRALRSDIRQQVEAEEKFKLINRFKEK